MKLTIVLLIIIASYFLLYGLLYSVGLVEQVLNPGFIYHGQ